MKKALIEFKPGDIVKIKCLDCGRKIKNRLCDLGLYHDAEIEIIKNDMAGPLIIKIFNSRMALGRGQASKIYGKKI